MNQQQTNTTSRRPRRPARAFTVIELLVVMLILGLLVAMSFTAFNAAVEQSRVSRTKVIIAKLDQLVMDKWNDYKTRAVPVRYTGSRTANNYTREAALFRLYALREIQRMEFPNTRADVNDVPVLVTRTGLNRAYQRKVSSSWSDTWQHAECLYLIVSSIRDDEKSALDFFTKDEIGDLDNDGVPEILDGWGNPIQFIRWAPGYRLDATNPALTMQYRTAADQPQSVDEFDLLKADRRWTMAPDGDEPFYLKPLIYSTGPDRQVGAGIILPSFGYSTTPINSLTPYANDPYYSPSGPEVGSIDAISPVTVAEAIAAAADNITNHYQEAE